MTERFDSNIGKRSFRVVLEQDAGGAERLRWHGYEAGAAVSYSVEPHTSLWQRVMAGLMRLLPVESQL